MKKITLTLSLILGVAYSFGQYTFTKTTGTYANLVSPTSLTNGNTWDDPQLTIPLGFNFQYFDSTVSTMFIEDYGLGSDLVVNDSEAGIIPTLSPFDVDIIDRAFDVSSGTVSTGGLSPISYKLSGATGSRILKIEWRNVGFYDDKDDDGNSIDFANFQVWLFEGTNNIELHYGPNSITQPLLCYESGTGAVIELFPELNYTTDESGPNVITLIGNPTAPSVKIINSFDSLESLNATIPNGTIYRFTKTGGTVSIKENKASFNTIIFPNPANNFINISVKENNQISQVEVMDINGKLIRTINNQFTNIDVSDLTSGIYIVKVLSNEGLISNSKFVKN